MFPFFNNKTKTVSADQDFEYNMTGDRAAARAEVDLAEQLDLSLLTQYYPTAQRAYSLPLETALSTGFIFDVNNDFAQAALLANGFIKNLKILSLPAYRQHGFIFKEDRYHLSADKEAVRLAYSFDFSAHTKRSIAEYEVLHRALFEQGLSNAKLFINFDKDSSISQLHQTLKQIRHIARHHTSLGVTFLHGAQAQSLTVSLEPTLKAISAKQEKISADVNIPLPVLFEQQDSSSVFSGKSNSQLRYEQRIQSLQDVLLYDFYSRAFALCPLVRAKKFRIPQAFGADELHWTLYEKLARFEFDKEQYFAQADPSGIHKQQFEDQLQKLKADIFNY